MIRGALVVALLSAATCVADVRLPKVVGSHMVLQRNAEVRVWGRAEPGEVVRVQGDWLDDIAECATDEQGRWATTIRTGAAGGPHSITISGRNTIELRDVLFGEVWLASGQSNMEMPLIRVSGAYTGIRDAAAEVAAADHPQIRLFQVGNFSSREPLEDVENGIVMYGIPPAPCTWQACTPETIPTFSSTAYFFARELHRRLEVPIGIIDASWGGTSAEVWTPSAGLKELGYANELKQAESLPQKSDQKIPTRLYNGMIHPLRHVRIRGAVWYQGEGNARRADRYQELFSTMIQQWRAAFGQDFPFYFVQIAPFRYNNVNAAFLREAQLKARTLAGTGMVVTMDIGNLTDIHPKNKQEVGRRLALWALAKDYGQDVGYRGPAFRSAEFNGRDVRVRFNFAAGLKTSDGKPPSHFQLAGGDRVFHPATATIEGETIIVMSSEVAEPKAVRYAFTSEAQPNIVNGHGLPATSFRSDEWK